jgi:hypothetical protein
LSTMNKVLGIDVGGSGIKGAPVDLEVGDFAEPRLRIPTPQIFAPLLRRTIPSSHVASVSVLRLLGSFDDLFLGGVRML